MRDAAAQVVRGTALLGYVPIGSVGLVLLATRIRDVLTLPGGHVIKLVVESKWYNVPLQVPFFGTGYRAFPEAVYASSLARLVRCICF